MKKIIILFLMLFCACAVFAAQTVQKNGVYKCSYKPNKNTTYGYMFFTDKTGNITSGMDESELPLEKLIKKGYCTFAPNINYSCKYEKGSCEVTIFGYGGNEVSCTGETPHPNKVLQEVNAGKCSKN